MIIQDDLLRQAMRCWTTGVCVVTSRWEGVCYGMTVNSFTSVSLEPPVVTVTLADNTYTRQAVDQSGIFAITILSYKQQTLAERFAGLHPEIQDRFENLETFTLATGAPFLSEGVAFLDCIVRHTYPLATSSLFIGEVASVQYTGLGDPLVYHNRSYHRLP
ncbi:MAG: flavin reductase family protein [Anaerolineaceae bacterium]|nr:flavin reductase family protein [Anaerolineaceae bacterium]